MKSLALDRTFSLLLRASSSSLSRSFLSPSFPSEFMLVYIYYSLMMLCYDVINFIPTMEKDKNVHEEDLGDLEKAFEELENPLNLTDEADKEEV